LCGLQHLVGRLDEVESWSLQLSPGEQQRLAFARALIQRPDWLFLDEATAALDEPTEAILYQLLRRELARTAIVSIGHRTSLRRFHERSLRIELGENGATLVEDDAATVAMTEPWPLSLASRTSEEIRSS